MAEGKLHVCDNVQMQLLINLRLCPNSAWCALQFNYIGYLHSSSFCDIHFVANMKMHLLTWDLFKINIKL